MQCFVTIMVQETTENDSACQWTVQIYQTESQMILNLLQAGCLIKLNEWITYEIGNTDSDSWHMIAEVLSGKMILWSAYSNLHCQTRTYQ